MEQRVSTLSMLCPAATHPARAGRRLDRGARLPAGGVRPFLTFLAANILVPCSFSCPKRNDWKVRASLRCNIKWPAMKRCIQATNRVANTALTALPASAFVPLCLVGRPAGAPYRLCFGQEATKLPTGLPAATVQRQPSFHAPVQRLEPTWGGALPRGNVDRTKRWRIIFATAMIVDGAE